MTILLFLARVRAVAVVLTGAAALLPCRGAADATFQSPARGARPAASAPAAPVKSGPASAEEVRAHPRFTPEIGRFVENFKPGGHDLTGQITLLPPQESLKQLHAPEGYAIELAAHEPVIQQPIDLRFDERGRLWVVQYRQYPFPAGMTVTSYDQYLRTEFDRISPPPPHHFRGADKITILEDTNGDGIYDRQKDFVDGLNMATSIEFGNDGVWVLQSPYLLFYPDRNHNDIPDGDPEGHLTGFGLEDTHSLASSLHWGPDGWLYGAKGSTTNLDIKGVRLLGQGIWRYHPVTKAFEVFAEGGGNTVSFEIDQFGRAYSGTNGYTRGFHYAQGASYSKGWEKAGPPMNPFIFGFFRDMEHEGYNQRFPQTFLLYEGGLLADLQGQIVVGMSMTNRVQASRVFPDTSTFRTVDGLSLVLSDDKAFRPTDIEAGPDGCIYVADWYESRLSHLNPRDTWDKASGRIYRITPKNFVRPAMTDVRKSSTAELIKFLSHPNRWYREVARRLLVDRPERIDSFLKEMVDRGDPAALEAFWVLNLRGKLDRELVTKGLRHTNEHIRRWTVRLLGDQGNLAPELPAALASLARTETNPEVLSQLASSAKRLPAGQAFPIIRELLQRDEVVTDKHIPLLVWWAIESKADTGRAELLAMLRDPAIWRTKLFAGHVAQRLGLRYTLDQGPRKTYTLKQGNYSPWIIEYSPEHLRRNLETCGRLIAAAPDDAGIDRLIEGMAEGLAGKNQAVSSPERWTEKSLAERLPPKPVGLVPDNLREIIERLWSTRAPHSAALVALAGRLNHPGAVAEAVAMVQAGKLSLADRERLIDVLGSTATPEALPVLAGLFAAEKNEAQRTKILSALDGFSDVAAADVLMQVYSQLSLRHQVLAQRMLSERSGWALVMLQRMNAGTFNPRILSESNTATIRAYNSPQHTGLLASYQKSRAEDPSERAGQQLFERGKTAYALNCAPCHQDNGQGLSLLAPSLVASPWVQQGEVPMVRIVLHGKENPAHRMVMPSLRHLDDGQISSILTYVRREFGNQSGMITPEKVAEIRGATAGRQKSWTDKELATLPK